MKAIDAFNRALFYVSGLCSSITLNVPGAVIKRLSLETREALKGLKSEEIGSNVRLDDLEFKYYVGSDEWYREQEFKKDRLEFDKKLKK